MKKRSVLVLILLSLFIVGCAGEDVTRSSRDAAASEMKFTERVSFDIEEQRSTEPELIFPLTGMEVNEPSTNRIISVMVNNHPDARPQSGLSKADLVFEILSEGQTTRFMAMFQSELPEVVGPVRSARPYYFNLADDYDALYIYHGAAQSIQAMLTAGAADYLNGSYYDNDGHLFNRESFRVAPHNSYLNLHSVKPVAESKGYEVEMEHRPLSFLAQNELDDIPGEPRMEVAFNYGRETVRYRYDTESESYFRYNNESQTVELNDQTPIKLQNVFIIETSHQVIDNQGRREIDFQSGGAAYLLQRGHLQKVQWENNDGYLVPTADGVVIPLVPGKTWVNVIPTNPGLDGVVEIE